MLNEDNAAYLRYTGPQRIDKAMHTLEGIIRGIAIDGIVSTQELTALTSWISDHQQYADRHPFTEVLDRLRQVLMDGVVDEEERADVLWLCEKFSTENAFFNRISSDMQRLQGIMRGIAADGKITKLELEGLREWMADNDHLKTCWPYDELSSLITTVLQDGVVDSTEHEALMQFFNEFVFHVECRSNESQDAIAQPNIQGICTVCPDVEFSDRTFCFTGQSERVNRSQLESQVVELGGKFSRSVTRKVDYLVVGADGNPCWAFSCYGRKVETAVKLRKQGLPILIVHENDYWDALEEIC